MKKIYTQRHEVLGYLFSKLEYTSHEKIDIKQSLSTHEEIAASLKIPVEEFYRLHMAFHEDDLNHVKCGIDGNNHAMVITENGIGAFIEEYWLSEGQNNSNNRIYDKTKWLVPIIALIVTIVGLSISIYSAVNTSQRVTKIESVVKHLNDSSGHTNKK